MFRPLALALIVAAVVFTGWRWGSFVAGGSDSACYATQAVRWARVLRHPGSSALQAPEALALAAPWPDAAWTFTPTGHVASRTVPGAFVPICPAGLSMVMAPLYLAGGVPLMFAAVPLFGVVLVLAAHAIGARFGPRVGVAAALLTAASPVFLYQVVQPMSDVPAAALWAVAVAGALSTRRRHAALAGIATSAAVLVRPNLVPLGFVIGMFLLLQPERSREQRQRQALIYAAWCAPGCLAVALIQQYFYGSPLASGYGTYAAIFARDHIGPNLARYVTWLWSACTPAIALVVLAPVLLPGAMTTLLLGLFAVNLALYLPYVVFDDWSYLRFLLPTIPFLLVVAAAIADGLVVRLLRSGIDGGEPRLRRQAGAALAVMALVLAIVFVRGAYVRHAFALQRMEARFARAGEFVAQRLPPNALVITDYESGSVPFYSGRQALAWGALDPAWLDRALAFVRTQGFEPYLLFERAEEDRFKSRFAHSDLGALDWPPMADVATQVRIYRVADRDRYRAGLPVRTEYAR